MNFILWIFLLKFNIRLFYSLLKSGFYFYFEGAIQIPETKFSKIIIMFKKALICCFLILAGLKGFSQSLYEVKFTDKDKLVYTGLLVYFNESKGYMRIAYTLDKVYNVVNVDYISVVGKLRDETNYFFMQGSHPRFITRHSSDQRYNPDYFIWTWGKGEEKKGLPYTTDDSTFKPDNMIRVNSFVQLKPENITDAYLHTFFDSNENEYFSMKKMCGIDKPDNHTVVYNNNTRTTTSTNKNLTLHFIIIANTLDGTIGKGCSADKDRLEYEFSNIADALQVAYKQYEVSGNEFKKNNLVNILNSINPSPDDIVIFVYRGHGFRWSNQTENWPMLDLRTSFYTKSDEDNSISLSNIYTTLVKKGARLNIILGDCCNSDIGITKITSNNFLNPQADNKPDINKLRRLFISAKGNILSAAAKPGEYSWVSEVGGFYTISFLQAMKEQISFLHYDDPDWNKIVNYTVELAREKTSKDHCSNCSIQDGLLYTHIDYVQ